jgi:hypothetical protein
MGGRDHGLIWGTEESHENPQDIPSPRRDLNPRSLEYEAGALIALVTPFRQSPNKWP